MDIKVLQATKFCTGCRSCELACSYHHKKNFAPGVSSIHVQRNQTEGKIDLLLYLKSQDGHLRCDCRPGEEFCLRFCPDIARAELKALLKMKEEE